MKLLPLRNTLLIAGWKRTPFVVWTKHERIAEDRHDPGRRVHSVLHSQTKGMSDFPLNLNGIAHALAKVSVSEPIDWDALRKMTEEQVPEVLAQQSAQAFVSECAKRARTPEAVKFVRLYYARNWIRERNAFYIPSLQAVYVDYTWWSSEGASVLPEWNRVDQASYDAMYLVPLVAPNVIYCQRAFLCPRCLNFWNDNDISTLKDKQADADEQAVHSFFSRCVHRNGLHCSADEINGIISKCYQKPFEYKVHNHGCRNWFDSIHFEDVRQRQPRQLSAEWLAEHPNDEFPPSVYYSIRDKTFDACLRHHGKWVRQSFARIEDAVLFVEAKLAEPEEDKKVTYPTKAEYQFFSMANAASEIMKGNSDTITDVSAGAY
jgi:hypothetical protein